MKWNQRNAMRRRVDRMLQVQSHSVRESLPADFTRSTMAKVRTANARMQQRAACVPQYPRGLAPAAIALAVFVVIAAITALMIQNQSERPAPFVVANSTSSDPTIAKILPSEREIRSMGVELFDDAIIAPFKQEADALIGTGREVGLTMLSALPARPSAWSEHLSESPRR